MDDLKLQIIQKGVQGVLDEAKVPQRVHLQVLQQLAERINQHKADLTVHQEDRKKSQDLVESHERQIQQWDELQKKLTSIERLQGDPGKDADPVDTNALVEQIMSQLQVPTTEDIGQYVLSRMPVPEDGKPGDDAVIDEDAIINGIIERLKKDKILDLSHIKGAQTFIKDGVKYRFEELMHGGGSTGGSASIFTQTPDGLIDGSNKSYTTIHAITTVIGLWYNGEFVHPAEYTVAGSGFTMGTALPVISGAAFTISYV